MNRAGHREDSVGWSQAGAARTVTSPRTCLTLPSSDSFLPLGAHTHAPRRAVSDSAGSSRETSAQKAAPALPADGLSRGVLASCCGRLHPRAVAPPSSLAASDFRCWLQEPLACVIRDRCFSLGVERRHTFWAFCNIFGSSLCCRFCHF